ncbi:unnamed protein product, partial [Timema podura]|nr:unnamed protein product [Timema podura]
MTVLPYLMELHYGDDPNSTEYITEHQLQEERELQELDAHTAIVPIERRHSSIVGGTKPQVATTHLVYQCEEVPLLQAIVMLIRVIMTTTQNEFATVSKETLDFVP